MSALFSWCLTQCSGCNSYSINACWFTSEEMERELLGQKQLGHLTIKIRISKGAVNGRYFRAKSQTDVCANSSQDIITTWGMELCDFSHVPHEDMCRSMCLLLNNSWVSQCDIPAAWQSIQLSSPETTGLHTAPEWQAKPLAPVLQYQRHGENWFHS